TTRPSGVRKRVNGSTASLTAIGAPNGNDQPSWVAGRSPVSRNWAIVKPTPSFAAALAKATPVAFETKGTVREARGFASITYKISAVNANWILIRPRTPTPWAIASVASRTRANTSGASVVGGSTHAESPECTP